MKEKGKIEGMLSPYRVLDLTDEKGLYCGKLMGDLGADVIKIERPGGDPARNIGPFYHDEVDPEKSLFWFAFNTSKRGITLDIEKAKGQELFQKLAKGADFVIESFPPGYMEKLGLGYSALEKLNSGVIMVSITPFGQTGPYKDYKGPDIVTWAMGGNMLRFGDADRPPVRISHPCQAYLHGAGEAAVGAMGALYYRQMTGEGQQVDCSIEESVARMTITGGWQSDKMIIGRGGGGYAQRRAVVRNMWACKDGGYVSWQWWGGTTVARRNNPPMLKWMEEEGMLDDFLREFDWDTYDAQQATQETVDRIEKPTAAFFMTHTKAEIYKGALEHDVQCYPLATIADIRDHEQLAARGYWAEVEHPELGAAITYPATFGHFSETPPKIWRRAPLIGEHNQEVYGEELGLSAEEITTLKQNGVI